MSMGVLLRVCIRVARLESRWLRGATQCLLATSGCERSHSKSIWLRVRRSTFLLGYLGARTWLRTTRPDAPCGASWAPT
jgi:hypothetical protein